MSTDPRREIPLEQLEVAEAFFAELGIPFSWTWDPVAETFSAHAFLGVDLVDAPASRGAARTRRPGRRRSR